MKREGGKTTQRKKGSQPGHQCKQPITLMSSSYEQLSEPSPEREKGQTLLPSITYLPSSHRWCQTLLSPPLLDCTLCGWQVGSWGFSSVKEPPKGRERHRATLRWGCVSRKWVKVWAELCVVTVAGAQGKSKKMADVNLKCSLQQAELMQRRASQCDEGTLQTTSSEEQRLRNQRNSKSQCVAIADCVPFTHLCVCSVSVTSDSLRPHGL